MKLIKVTLCLAFQDCYEPDADDIREQFVTLACDGLYAERVMSDITERDVDIPDPMSQDCTTQWIDWTDCGNSMEEWQYRAVEEMDTLLGRNCASGEAQTSAPRA